MNTDEEEKMLLSDVVDRIANARRNLKHKCTYAYAAPMPVYAQERLSLRSDKVYYSKVSVFYMLARLDMLLQCAERLLSIKFIVTKNKNYDNSEVDAVMERLDFTDQSGFFFSKFKGNLERAAANIRRELDTAQ